MRAVAAIALATLAAFAAAAAVAGCTGSSSPAPVGGTQFDQYGCQIGCMCKSDGICVSTPYQPACLPACATVDDCAAGEMCVVLRELPDTPVCLTPSRLMVCHATPCMLTPQCRDPQTLMKPLPATATACGWELVPCVSGCDSASGHCK